MPHPPTPAEDLATILRCVTQAVVTQGLVGRIANLVVSLLVNRFRTTYLAFARLAASIEAGTYRPRRFFGRRPPAVRTPCRKSLVPQKFGWLMPLLPMPDGNIFRGQLENLLRDPEMVKLIAAAPASAARLLRPICWTLRIETPKILARPRAAAAPPPAEASEATEATVGTPASPPLPRPPAAAPRPSPRRLPPPCAYGPPRTA